MAAFKRHRHLGLWLSSDDESEVNIDYIAVLKQLDQTERTGGRKPEKMKDFFIVGL